MLSFSCMKLHAAFLFSQSKQKFSPAKKRQRDVACTTVSTSHSTEEEKLPQST